MLFHPEHLPLDVHSVNTLFVKGIAQLSLLSTTMNRAPGSPRVLSPYARMLTQCVEDPSLPISWTIAIVALFATKESANASAVSLIPSLHVPHLILQILRSFLLRNVFAILFMRGHTVCPATHAHRRIMHLRLT